MDWGRTPPEKRGRWGRWLYLHRWNAGRQTQDDVRETLAKMGSPIGPSYYSEIENGTKKPNADWQAIFIRLWGDEPEPEPEPEPETDNALVTAIRELVEEVRLSRQASDRNADVLAQLLGVVLSGRLPQAETEGASAAPAPVGSPQR